MEDKAIEIEQEVEEEDQDENDGGEQDEGEEEYAEEQEQKQPPRKVTKNIKGQKRDYNFLKSVKSPEELDNIRFKNYCTLGAYKSLPTFKSRIMPCTRKRWYKLGKQCDFELMALRQKSGIIDVYTHSEHNHQFMPEKKRTSLRNAKELMPAENPPQIFRTPDNIEWTFLRTFPDYEQMQQFRRKSQCTFNGGRENHHRFRLPCNLKKYRNCEFTLLALKTTSAGYHIYNHGKHNQHNHPAMKPKKNQQPACCDDQQKQQEMEVDEKNEEGQDELIEEEDDDILLNEDEDEDDIILIEVEQQQEEKGEGSMEKMIVETPLENEEATPREEILELEEKLQKASAKVYKWMAGIEPNQIGPTLEGWDNCSVLKIVQMGEQEIREHPEKFNVWRPWLKFAIKRCLSIEGFGSKYKDLIILMLDNE